MLFMSAQKYGYTLVIHIVCIHILSLLGNSFNAYFMTDSIVVNVDMFDACYVEEPSYF